MNVGGKKTRPSGSTKTVGSIYDYDDPLSRHSRARREQAGLIAVNIRAIDADDDDNDDATSSVNVAGTAQASTSFRMLHVTSFLLFFSSSLVILSPAPALMQWLDSASSVTLLLSGASAMAAVVEIATSHRLGRALDVHGRKPTLLATTTALALTSTLAAMHPCTATLLWQKLVGTLAVGFFLLASQAMISDIASMATAATTATTMSTTALAVTTAHATNHPPAKRPPPPPPQSQHNNGSGSSSSSSHLVSAAMGEQMALTGLGFLLGIVGAGQLSERNVSTLYGIAAGVATVALLLVKWGLSESLPPRVVITNPHNHNHDTLNNSNDNNNKHQPVITTTAAATTTTSASGKTLGSVVPLLLSCTRLLTRHGPEVRRLGILLMLMTLPMFMGDFFQIFAKSEWNLTTKAFSTFLALYGVVGIVSNTAGSRLVRRMGIKRFTALAILSRILASIGTVFFGYQGSVIGLIIGFLGGAQSIGILAALVSEGAQSGLPQGELAGERAALMALLKIIGPIWYSTLYTQGRRYMNTSYLPFLFNLGLSVVALILSQRHLS